MLCQCFTTVRHFHVVLFLEFDAYRRSPQCPAIQWWSSWHLGFPTSKYVSAAQVCSHNLSSWGKFAKIRKAGRSACCRFLVFYLNEFDFQMKLLKINLHMMLKNHPSQQTGDLRCGSSHTYKQRRWGSLESTRESKYSVLGWRSPTYKATGGASIVSLQTQSQE